MPLWARVVLTERCDRLSSALGAAGVRATRLDDLALARLYRLCWGAHLSGEGRLDRDLVALFGRGNKQELLETSAIAFWPEESWPVYKEGVLSAVAFLRGADRAGARHLRAEQQLGVTLRNDPRRAIRRAGAARGERDQQREPHCSASAYVTTAPHISSSVPQCNVRGVCCTPLTTF